MHTLKWKCCKFDFFSLTALKKYHFANLHWKCHFANLTFSAASYKKIPQWHFCFHIKDTIYKQGQCHQWRGMCRKYKKGVYRNNKLQWFFFCISILHIFFVGESLWWSETRQISKTINYFEYWSSSSAMASVASRCWHYIFWGFFERKITCKWPGPQFNKKMSNQYTKSLCGDKTVVRSSYLHNGISYTGKMSSLYWIRALYLIFKLYKDVNPCTIHQYLAAVNNNFLLNYLIPGNGLDPGFILNHSKMVITVSLCGPRNLMVLIYQENGDWI